MPKTAKLQDENMRVVDLRSDTVTKPTPAMWKAMANAEVGDDVYGEDPTVNRLEKMASERMGKEAALFVPSGTMGNLISILTHCNRGDEVVMGKKTHTFLEELGGAAALGGVHSNTLTNQPDGTLKLGEIRDAIRADDIHFPISSLIILENTHADTGGNPLSVEYTQQVGALAKEHGLNLHIDGARIFNAAVALGVRAADLVDPADSVSFCLSKGLCAPIGSLLCGSGKFIAKARRARKQLGAGMRQVGIIAAAGIVALEENVERLVDDHRRMRLLAEGLSTVHGLNLQKKPPVTNMLFFEIEEHIPYNADQLIDLLKKHNVLCNCEGGERRIRLVTHYWIEDDDITFAVETFHTILGHR
jgi:threonine aldolase